MDSSNLSGTFKLALHCGKALIELLAFDSDHTLKSNWAKGRRLQWTALHCWQNHSPIGALSHSGRSRSDGIGGNHKDTLFLPGSQREQQKRNKHNEQHLAKVEKSIPDWRKGEVFAKNGRCCFGGFAEPRRRSKRCRLLWSIASRSWGKSWPIHECKFGIKEKKPQKKKAVV